MVISSTTGDADEALHSTFASRYVRTPLPKYAYDLCAYHVVVGFFIYVCDWWYIFVLQCIDF